MGTKGSCKAEGCSKDVVGKGYCSGHYKKWRQGTLPKARYATCKQEGCRKKQVAFARCAEHQKKKPVAAEAAPAAAAPAAEAPAAEG
ncbi:MAG: vegetative protein [Alphaproteobacteria bacterium]